MYWALVYVPQGTSAGNINVITSATNPNQFVMNCGVVDADAGPIRFSSPLARNLNDGDAIVLLMRPLADASVVGTVRYAISLH